MKKIHIFILSFFVLFFVGGNLIYASSDKNENSQTRTNETAQHPPHDHPQTDHIKKLDEWIQRRRKYNKQDTTE